MSEKVLCVQCRKCHNTIPLIGCGTHCPHCNALMVVANLVSVAKEEEGRKEEEEKE